MSAAQQSREERIAQLRRRWLGHAAAAFDLMFHPDHQPDLATFDQREQRVVDLGEDLKNWLLQQHLAVDPHAAAPADQAVACPHCGKAAQRVERPDKPLFERRLTTLCGEVLLQRDKWRCPACRVAFFPSGPATAAGQ
jgi:hypothetical protein